MSNLDDERRKNSGTFSALMALVLLSGLLLLLVATVLPQVLGLVSVVIGIFFFCAFHYLVWGHWLDGRRRASDDEDDEAEREHLKKYGPHH